jgi:FMN-dependent oxidoreductase (nitrilotriacetate monooxygenase family)
VSRRQVKFGALLTPTGGPGAYGTWLDPEIPGDASVDVDWYIDVARQLEAAKFDHIFIADSQFITPDSPPHYLNRLEPISLLSALAVVTSHIGLVATISTTYHAPFSIARRFATLDNISKGRAGWNVITTGDSGTAGNFGIEEHPDHDERYARAREAVQVVQALWDSYEDDAFPRDRATGQFFDRTKQHVLDHHGDYFSVTGPLNVQRSPQGQPVIFQAGASAQGLDLGAEIAEAVFTLGGSFDALKAFRAETRARVAAKGRNPDHTLIFPGVSIVVGDTDEDARRIEREIHQLNADWDKQLAEFGRSFGWHDFTQYELDAPFPDLGGVGVGSFGSHVTAIVGLADREGLTLRETVLRVMTPPPSPFTGSAETIADAIEHYFTGGALDGLNVLYRTPSQFARFADEVLPILRRRGLAREEYDSTTLRGNYGLPIPENRYTAARREPRLLEAVSAR